MAQCGCRWCSCGSWWRSCGSGRRRRWLIIKPRGVGGRRCKSGRDLAQASRGSDLRCAVRFLLCKSFLLFGVHGSSQVNEMAQCIGEALARFGLVVLTLSANTGLRGLVALVLASGSGHCLLSEVLRVLASVDQ